MLKGKKKALAAQVLLGLMIAGQAHAADFSVEAVEGSDSKADTIEGNTFYAGGYNIKDDTVLAGGAEGKFLIGADSVSDNTIAIKSGGWNFFVVDAQNASGNTINFGDEYQPDEYVHQFGNVKVFKNSGTGNTINIVKAGIINWGGIDAGAGNTMNVERLVAVGTDNDYTLKAGVLNVNGSSMGAENLILSADTVNINGDAITARKIAADGAGGGNVTIVGNDFKADEVSANNVNVLGDGTDINTVQTDTLKIGARGTLHTANLNDINEVIIDGMASANVLTTKDDISGAADKIKLVNAIDTQSSKLLIKESRLSVDTNSVTLNKNVVGTQERSKSLVETQVANLAMLMSSADLLTNAGYTNASQAVRQAKAEGGSAREMVPYAAASYGNIRQESGSHVDVKGSAFNIGFAKEVTNRDGSLLFGPMFEYGRGSYESYLDDGTKGKGNAQNFGVGVMVRQNNNNGMYYEGSLRYGRLTSDYNSRDIGADYDTTANYWGAHLGAGKVFAINDSNSIDAYGKFFYSKQGSSSVVVDGSNVNFDSAASKRSRIGFRFNHITSDVRSIYTGLAWQHEFDGSAAATVDGFSTPSPSIKGDSVMAELGIKIQPKESPLGFDLGVSGWSGRQKGYTLNANMYWRF